MQSHCSQREVIHNSPAAQCNLRDLDVLGTPQREASPRRNPVIVSLLESCGLEMTFIEPQVDHTRMVEAKPGEQFEKQLYSVAVQH
jgi:hypothetical protein